MIKETDLRRAVGCLFALRLPSSWTELNLDKFPVANYIVFRDNMEPSFEDSRRRFSRARSFLEVKGIEPIFMMDEEGGRVTQISGFFQSAPSPRAVSKTLKPEEAARLYGHMSAYIADLGIDVNLFPCVDVNTEPLNPVIGTRSYGASSEEVSLYSKAIIGSSRMHTGCVVKHFPGHGMTQADSHLERPVVEVAGGRFEYMHVHPFREAMRSGADGVMVGHCLYLPFQTDDLPASLSMQIVGSMLRQRLRCDSLVLTDSLDMQAVTKHVDARRAGLLALRAGCDILLYTEYSERFEESFEAVLEAFLMGRLPEERLADSTKRRENLIERLRFTRSAKPQYQEQEYLELLQRVWERSVTISDPEGILPLSCEEAVVVSTSTAVTERLKDHVPSIKQGSDVSDAADRTLILWIMEPLRPGVSFKKVQTLLESAAQSILITTYGPLIERLPGCDVTISSDDTSPHTVDAIIRRLFEG